VGKRELDITWLFLELAPPFGAVRSRELTLEVEDIDMPRAFDLDTKSGVLREDDGVTLLRGTAGERAVTRTLG
jgi:hypothetical protein